MRKYDGLYTLGLDIGVGSVGWGIIDEDRNIIDAGVRIFPEADKSFNEKRRDFRGARRLLRRRLHRIERVKKLLVSANLIESDDSLISNNKETPYHLRCRGLHHKLSKEELAIALLHLAKRRGIHNVEGLENEKDDENSLSTKEQIAKNERLLQDKYICELQLERLENNGRIRGHENRFKTEHYVKEAKKILETQSKYHAEVDNEFINQYVEILTSRREYYHGPGKGSPYGWDQDIKKWYEQMMGRCSYYPDQLRAVKESYSAQLFNLLNDLNNLSINREGHTKLTKDEKEGLIKDVFKKYKNVTLKRIAQYIDVNESDIKGYRIDKSEKPIFTSLTIYHDLRKIVDNDEILENPDSLNQIAEILTIYQHPSDKMKELTKLNLALNKSKLEKISELDYSKTHSLSLKLIKEMLPDLWETNKNHMQLLTEYGLKPKKIELKGKKYIPTDFIDDWILSPVVKRSMHQAIRIINGLIKTYGYPKDIVIELAREKNSQEQKKFLQNLQKKNEALNREIREKLSAKGIEKAKGLFNKLRLWHLQDGHCMYSLRPIPIEDLLENHLNYEIDHIIPQSVSFDDSINNKVLVFREENQKKENRTPFQYLNSGQGTISYEKFKAHVLQMAKSKEKVPPKKLQYLLEERDINKFDVQKEFINRNLVDTRYATREMLMLLNSFFKENLLEVKVKAINGSFTHYLRKLWDFPKDRGVDYKHHAEDALIIAMSSYLFENNKKLEKHNLLLYNGKIVEQETGEILSEDQLKEIFTDKMNKVNAIKNYSNYKYSHKVDKKPNRQLMNDTIYSTRKKEGKEYVIEKIKESELYSKDSDKLAKLIKNTPEKLLMYHHDPKTFEELKKVFIQYSDAKNPLYKYVKENNISYFRKYSKKGNGPEIKSIKYFGNLLKEHKDITNKYNTKDKKVVSLSLKPFRMDVFFEDNRYKFITIRYNDLIEKKDRYIIDEKLYKNKLKEKNINDENNFLFSLYKNDLLELDGEEYRLIGVNQDSTNKIELNKINCDYKEYCRINNISDNRIRKTIGKNTNSFNKISVDVLGNRFFNKEKIIYTYLK